MNTKKLISLVLPAYQEEDTLALFYNRLSEFIDQKLTDYDWEFIFVDDGSSDNTLNIVKEIRSSDSRVKWVSLARNFGHQSALYAGLEKTKGSAVITMDTDLQHPVEILPDLIQKWKSGCDIVLTVRKDDSDLGIVKRLTSYGFYKLINMLSKTDIKPSASDFRLMSRKSLEAFLQIKEIHRFNRGIVSWMGFKTGEIEFAPCRRSGGDTKYTFRKMIGLALDGITSFTTVPLRISGIVGVLICTLSAGYAVYAFFVWLQKPGDYQIGWASLIISIHFLCGSILIFLGIIGEYIGKIYEQVKQRPIYLIKDTDGFD